MRILILGLFLALGAGAAAAGEASPNARYCAAFWRTDGSFGSKNQPYDEYEAEVRKKCQVGDIITVADVVAVAHLCDLSKPVVSGSEQYGHGGHVCYLAPKREVY